MGFYEKYIKRAQDILLSSLALVALSPVMAVTAVLVRTRLGSPVIFTQDRPGRDGKIFKLYKFRTMTDARDAKGNLLSDEERLTDFGKKLRATSLEGNDIIRQTTKSLINKGFREVSPIHFFNGCNLISNDFRVMIA